MRALLDTNIVIHREAATVVNQDIGTLFKWLDKAKYEKCVHPITVEELHARELVRRCLLVDEASCFVQKAHCALQPPCIH